MNIHTHRRKRHRANAKLKNAKAVRKHERKTGRTGHIQSKKNHSTKCWKMVWRIPNPPFFFKI